MNVSQQRRSLGVLHRPFALILFLLGVVSTLHAQPLPTQLGDLNTDGALDVRDLVVLLNHLNASRDAFHSVPDQSLPAALLPFADVNEDGYLNQADVTMLRDAILGIPLPVNTRPVALEPATGSSEVGVTVRPKAMFPKPIDIASLNSNNFYATFAGRRLAATITPANNGTFAWLFFHEPMPNASQVQVTVDGSTLRTRTGLPLDADGDGALGGVMRFNFSTVSVTPIPGTVLSSRIVDPGPDLRPRTEDDVIRGNGFTYLLPIRGVKVYVLGMENNVAYTDADGRFTLTNMPVGDVKVVLDGRTATSPPAGYYFPEMVMDTTFEPGITNGVMNIVDTNGMVMRDGNGVPIRALAMYLPRVASNVLQTVSAGVTNLITLQSNAAYDLPPEQQPYLTVEIMPGSLIGMNGQPLATGQVGVSVVPPELVREMLPPGLLQHTFDITVQAPGIATFATPAPMTFPNVFNAPPGTKLNFLSFDHTTGRLVIEGTATVSEDGLFVRTDPGTGITHPGWHGLAPPGANCTGGPITGCTATGPCITSCMNGSLTGGMVDVNATEVCVGASFTFTASGVTDPGGQKTISCPCVPPTTSTIPPDTITFDWKISRDGGVVASGSGSSATHTATDGGIYTCSFTAKSQRECPPSDHTLPSGPSVAVSGIRSVKAQANGNTGQASQCDNSPVSFSAQVQQLNCGSLTYSWSFSDGTSDTSQSPTHQFPGLGDWTATVTVSCSGTNGCMDTKSDTVTVHLGTPPQSVEAEANGLDVANVYVGQPVSFTAQTTPPNFSGVDFNWDFGDGTSGQGAATVHAYSAAGDYTASVTARCANGLGTPVSDSVNVHVTVPPFPPIEADIVDEPPSGSTFTSGIDPNSIVLKLNGAKVMPSITQIQNGFHIFYVPNENEVQNPGSVPIELEASDNAKGDGTVGNKVISLAWSYRLP